MKLTIHRPEEKTYSYRNYRILFNDQTLDSIAVGQTIHLELTEPGYIQFKVDSFTGSPKMKLEQGKNHTLTISGRRSMSKLPILLVIVFVFSAIYSLRFDTTSMGRILLSLSGIMLLLISLFRNYWLRIQSG